MNRTIVKKPRAERDLLEHYAFIARDKIAPADHFLRIANRMVRDLAEMPTIGRRWISRNKALAGIRVYPMPSPFRKYLIFYRFDSETLEIIAVIHGARNLSALLRRAESEKPDE